MLKKIRSKVSDALRGLVKILENEEGKSRKPSANEFVVKKSVASVSPRPKKGKVLKIPKQTSFKGSGYKGKGSVNTDATTFHNSRG